MQSMLSGFSAAFLGPIATGPFDVIKTRLMAQSRTGELKYKVNMFVTWSVRVPHILTVFAFVP